MRAAPADPARRHTAALNPELAQLLEVIPADSGPDLTRRFAGWLAAENGWPDSQKDVIRNKSYNGRMITYSALQSDRREFLALTGLTLKEFRLMSQNR